MHHTAGTGRNATRPMGYNAAVNEPAPGHAHILVHPGLLFMGLLGAAGLLQYLKPLPLFLGPMERYAVAVNAATFVGGFGLGTWGFFSLRRGGTNVDPLQSTLRLIIRGPYRFTRNPLYISLLLVMLGFTILARSWWFLGAAPILAVLLNYLVILPEEHYLSGLFGEDYAAYCRRVRRWV